MKQRLGVAQSLLGRPRLLILDEPINGLDADGMRIVRETLLDLAKDEGVTVLISSHILGELSKIATHYGIIRNGTLIREMPASAMSDECRDFIFVKANDNAEAAAALRLKYREVEEKDGGVRVYDEEKSENISALLYENGVALKEIAFNKVGLEEYYLKVMAGKGGKAQ
jgi:ABC-2 type transport system ATP-binding protein